MKAKHTLGPWFYRRGDEWSHDVVTHHGELTDGSQSCWTVASINPRRAPEHEANARLIAAAPELLEALTKMLNDNSYYFPVGNSWGDHARAAIAKATGGVQS